MTHTDLDHDDRHDRGLLYDLATLRGPRPAPVLVERRGALKLMAVGGLGLVLVACGKSGPSSSAASSSTSSTAGAGTTTAASASGASGTVTDAIPEETGGPYPGDGSNGPNVLTESGIVRRDIRSSFGSSSGTAQGVPLGIDLTIVAAGSGSPVGGAAVYLWHCDREGRYSMYSSGVTGENYLRGVQVADADGNVTFDSIFPAAYSGRWPHIHFEVYPTLAAATGGGAKRATSQLALPEDVCRLVYATSGYEASVRNLAGTSLTRDMVFSDGVDEQLAAMTGSVTAGYTASLNVPV
jgi:protocatechuate 3,4-dioxygenase beta subunit